MTQAEQEMRASLLLADLWNNLRRIQIEIDSQIIPTLREFNHEPDEDLIGKLNAATDAIERYFQTNKLQITPSTK